jgi:CLIP-associating protein 1/2
VDALLNALKTCLKHPNHHLTTPTLNALPSFFRLATTGSSAESTTGVVDSVILRQILTAFLPAGGLIDRLGDSRERIRESAREAMVVLGGIAFRTGASSLQGSFRQKDTGKGPETPYMIWERFFKESGLQSKSAKVREQV